MTDEDTSTDEESTRDTDTKPTEQAVDGPPDTNDAGSVTPEPTTDEGEEQSIPARCEEELTFDHTWGTVETSHRSMFTIDGLSGTGNRGYGFELRLDASFAAALEALSVPDRRDAAANNLLSMHTDTKLANIRCKDDSFLLSNVTVAGQATGLDLTDVDEHRDEYVYHTHNVDTAKQAIQIISIFSKWIDLGRHLLENFEDKGQLTVVDDVEATHAD